MAYDFIFCGFGLSTILMLDEFEIQGVLNDKRVLILEKETAYLEKTWCFWESGAGKWDAMLSGKWHKGYVGDEKGRREILDGLIYKSISSATLRNHIVQKLKTHSCTFKDEQVLSWADEGNEVSVQTTQQAYFTKFFFNSGHDDMGAPLKSKLLLQHFEGWYIKTRQAAFVPSEATIMDFSVSQKGNTRFMYVLPFSKNTALAEYTLFSPALIPREEYEREIIKYLNGQGITEFEILGKETGIVPMTSHPFWEKNTQNVLHIGTAGGWTKASTGYTFANASKMAQKLAKLLKSDAVDFRNFYKKSRFNWYDKLFIEVLYKENAIGKKLFKALFFKTNANEMMRFLNEKTNLKEEFRIISACPKRPFLSALMRVLFRK